MAGAWTHGHQGAQGPAGSGADPDLLQGWQWGEQNKDSSEFYADASKGFTHYERRMLSLASYPREQTICHPADLVGQIWIPKLCV